MVSEPNSRWSDLEAEEESLLKDLGVPFGGRPACPPPDLLRALHGGVLPGRVGRRVEGHVAGCRFCQILTGDLAAVDAPLSPEENARIRARVFKPLSQGEHWRKRLLSWRLIPAIAAAAAISAVVWLHVARRPKSPEIVSSATTATSLADGSPVFALEKPPVALPVPLIMRGASAGRQAYFADLSRALKPYQSGGYAEAVRRLAPLARKYPRRPAIPFYLGVSFLFTGNNTAAAENLKRAEGLARGPLVDECQWYLALADVRLGQLAPATATLHRGCGSPGAYQGPSCAGLKELSPQGASSPR